MDIIKAKQTTSPGQAEQQGSGISKVGSQQFQFGVREVDEAKRIASIGQVDRQGPSTSRDGDQHVQYGIRQVDKAKIDANLDRAYSMRRWMSEGPQESPFVPGSGLARQ